MTSRRQFIGHGFGAVAAGILARTGFGQCPLGRDRVGLARAKGAMSNDPVALVSARPRSVQIAGLPFAPWFTGDGFESLGETHLPIQPFADPLTDLPEIDETTEVCVVGGGLSGMTAAYLLRDFSPVLLEVHDRFGGAARGENWSGHRYSLGNAYVITPDQGSFLASFYSELGLDGVVRESFPPDPISENGRLLPDFWNGGRADVIAPPGPWGDYADVVSTMATELYPDIPFDTSDPSNQWILDLDRKTFREDLYERMTLDPPVALQRAIQAYFYSSFGAGWEEISAASGWNFVAAEEYGRWVFPGGTSYMARALWSKLRDAERQREADILRHGCLVRDVRPAQGGVRVTYGPPGGELRSLLARRVIMACPKFVAQRTIHDLEVVDPPKFNAMDRVHYAAYMVANVLLDKPLTLDFYDIFRLLEDRQPPEGPDYCDLRPVADILNGDYTRSVSGARSVLTMYWPVPGEWIRYCMAFDSPLRRFATAFAGQIDELLGVVGLSRQDVVQIRLTRWGHAMPLAAPGLMADGTIDHLRRPYEGVVHFASQDNWSLPAVENSVLEARSVAETVRAELS